MATLVVEGQRLEVPDDLTDDERMAIVQAHMGQAPAAAPVTPPAAPEAGTAEYLLDRAKKSFTEGAGLVTAGAQLANPMRVLQPGGLDLKSAGAAGYQVQSTLEDTLGGVQNLPAPGPVSKLVGEGVAAAADPTNFLVPGGPAARTLPGKAVGAVQSMFANFMAGMGGSVGGDVGAQMGGTPGAVIGALAGGGAAGASAGLTRGGVQAVDNLRNPAHLVAEANKTLTQKATAAAQRLVRTAIDSDPDAVEKLVRLMELSEKSGIKLPLGAADNAVIDAAIARKGSTDPAWRQQYESQVKRAEAAIAARASSNFGDPNAAATSLSLTAEPPRKRVLQTKLDTLQTNKGAAAAKISAAILRGASDDSQAQGARVLKLVETQEKLAMDATKPFYDKAFEIAGDARPSDASLVGLREQAKLLNDQSFLRTMPVEAQRLIKRLAGEELPGSGLLDARGNPLGAPGTETIAKEFTLGDLDYVKRTVNKAIRSATPGSDRFESLVQLKGQVNKAIEGMPPEFVEAYKAADAQYLKTVGIPFDETAIAQLGRVKFDEAALPILIRNKSAMESFLAVGGPEAADVAKGALLSDLAKKAKDDVLSPQAITAWLATPKGQAAAAIPGVVESLRAGGGGLASLRAAGKRADDVYKGRLIANLVNTHGKSADAIGADLMSNAGKTNAYLASFKGDADGLAALRSVAVDHLLKQPDPVRYLQDAGRGEAVKRLFGAKYLEELATLSQLQTGVKRSWKEPAFNLDSVPKDLLEKNLGISGPQVFSTLRNQITSGVQKVAILASKIGNSKLVNAEERAIAAVLLDPDVFATTIKGLQAAAANANMPLTEWVKTMAGNPTAAAKVGSLIMSIGAGTAKGAYVGGKAGGSPEEAPEPSPADLTLGAN